MAKAQAVDRQVRARIPGWDRLWSESKTTHRQGSGTNRHWDPVETSQRKGSVELGSETGFTTSGDDSADCSAPLKSWSHHVSYGQASMQTLDDGHGPISSVRKWRYRDTQLQLPLNFALLTHGLTMSMSILSVHCHLPKGTHTHSHVLTATHHGRKQYPSCPSQQKMQLKLSCMDWSHGLESLWQLLSTVVASLSQDSGTISWLYWECDIPVPLHITHSWVGWSRDFIVSWKLL